MKISEKLADLNFLRFNQFSTPFNLSNAKQAAFMFKGDTYVGLNSETFTDEDIKFAQKQLRILSGLYGILKPLDLIQPYRLEMGARFEPPKTSDLYNFWGNRLTVAINEELKNHENQSIVNLASKEYFKAIKSKNILGEIITPVFKEIKGGKVRTLGMFAKRARGMMARFMIKNRVKEPFELKNFNEGGYQFVKDLSNDHEWTFTRQQPG